MVIIFGMGSCFLGHLNPSRKWLCHKLTKLLPSYLIGCKKDAGTAVYTIYMTTVMKPRVQFQPRWLKLAESTRFARTCAWIRRRVRIWLCCYYTVLMFPAKLIQVSVWLHEFTNITLYQSRSGRGTPSTSGISSSRGTYNKCTMSCAVAQWFRTAY